MTHYALVIDHNSCWGCRTCEVACKQELPVADGIALISLSEEGPGVAGDTHDFVFHVTVCRHCDAPPCVDACPEGAIVKREDGIVVMDYETCSGCGSCLEACPYHAIAFDAEKKLAQKCNLCHHRVDKYLIPACADNVCPAHCIHFGPVDEANKKVRNTLAL